MIFCLKEQPCHSITPDRGMEFASGEYLELSGNEEEIKKFYNIFGEYLR